MNWLNSWGCPLAEWIQAIPKNCPRVPEHTRLGKAHQHWIYKNQDGSLSWAVCRWDTPKGKEFRPATLWRGEDGLLHWLWRYPPSPRGLFGLDQLAARPDDPVLVVEGEKTADAAQKGFPDWVAITSGSATSAGSTDWSPLAGRQVVVWPDRDIPGRKYAEDVRKALQGIASSVAIVEVSENFNDGWDLADDPPSGWDEARLRGLLEAALELNAQTAWESHSLKVLPASLHVGEEEVRAFEQASEGLVEEVIPLECGLPSITVCPPEESVVNQALDSLSQRGRLFQRGHQLVHVSAPGQTATQLDPSGPSIKLATGAWMRLELSRVAAFYRNTEEGPKRIMVPEWLPQLALEMSNFHGLPELYALTETPVFLKDGTIHATPGWEAGTGIYFSPLGTVPATPDRPTLEDAKKAVSVLFNLVSDFPFANDESKGAWLALLLTVAARFAIQGPVPFWLIDANGQSAGKGLLTTVSSIIVLGRDPVSVVASKDSEEFRKNVLCTLMDGTRFAWLDEAESPFGGRRWNGLITATAYKDRILGTQKTWAGPHFTVWVASGNNVQLATDTPRRCVHVRLEPTQERPEERGDFKIKDLVEYTKRHRVELLGHVLTILRAYHVAERPLHGLTPWGSFEEWSRLIRECVFWCTGIDCDTRKNLTATADTSRESSTVILELLETLFPNQKTFLASDVLAAYEARDTAGHWAHPHLREALDAVNTNPRGLNTKGLGNLLKTRRDRNFSGRKLEGIPGGKHGMAYRVIQVSETSPGQRKSESPESPEPPISPPPGATGDSGGSDFPRADPFSPEMRLPNTGDEEDTIIDGRIAV